MSLDLGFGELAECGVCLGHNSNLKVFRLQVGSQHLKETEQNDVQSSKQLHMGVKSTKVYYSTEDAHM